MEELVEELVQECLTVSHPVGVAMLEKQYSLLQLKKLLHGYGIRDFNFSDTSKGWVSKNGWMCVYDRLDLHVTFPLEKSLICMYTRDLHVTYPLEKLY